MHDLNAYTHTDFSSVLLKSLLLFSFSSSFYVPVSFAFLNGLHQAEQAEFRMEKWNSPGFFHFC